MIDERPKKDEVVPNPGSDDALALGCTCPVLDNAHGEGITYGGERAWWINRKCPIHGTGE